jgi:hypothetical protein
MSVWGKKKNKKKKKKFMLIVSIVLIVFFPWPGNVFFMPFGCSFEV